MGGGECLSQETLFCLHGDWSHRYDEVPIILLCIYRLPWLIHQHDHACELLLIFGLIITTREAVVTLAAPMIWSDVIANRSNLYYILGTYPVSAE